MEHLDLFSGIGGFAYAADQVWNDVEHVFVDNDLFCQAVLKKHWPNAKIYGDIKTFTNTRGFESRRLSSNEWKEISKIGSVDIVTGGFPCQPFSHAGRRKGTSDNRYLWPEMFRIIREFSPTWVIAENVAGLVSWNEGLVLEQVCADLESEGYEVQAFIIPAVAVNAPHRRDRVWIVGHAEHDGLNATKNGQGDNQRNDSNAQGQEQILESEGSALQGYGDDTNTQRQGRARSSSKDKRRPRQSSRYGSNQGWDWDQNWLEVATELCVVDDGLSNGLARPRGWRNAALKGAGNAIVPQVAMEIMKAIKESNLLN